MPQVKEKGYGHVTHSPSQLGAPEVKTIPAFT